MSVENYITENISSLVYEADKKNIICNFVNDIGIFDDTLSLILSERWPDLKEKYLSWYKGNETVPFRLGNVLFVEVEENKVVALVLALRGIKSFDGFPPIRYDAVRKGLKQVRKGFEHDNTIFHMPKVGCLLAGCEYTFVERIIKDELCEFNFEVKIYDRIYDL
jgi:hypothetical protein